MGGGGKSKPKYKPAPLPKESYAEKGNAAEEHETRKEERNTAIKAQGNKSTILTGALGATDSANVQSKTLLGQ